MSDDDIKLYIDVKFLGMTLEQSKKAQEAK